MEGASSPVSNPSKFLHPSSCLSLRPESTGEPIQDHQRDASNNSVVPLQTHHNASRVNFERQRLADASPNSFDRTALKDEERESESVSGTSTQSHESSSSIDLEEQASTHVGSGRAKKLVVVGLMLAALILFGIGPAVYITLHPNRCFGCQ